MGKPSITLSREFKIPALTYVIQDGADVDCLLSVIEYRTTNRISITFENQTSWLHPCKSIWYVVTQEIKANLSCVNHKFRITAVHLHVVLVSGITGWGKER